MSAIRNILFIIADDLGKYVGCYGCNSVTTPNLDRLANEGVRFDCGLASTASCSGSRSTIYTGLHTHENGQYGLVQQRTHFQTFGHIDSLPALFNHAGYLTGIVGKIHVGDDHVYPWTIRDNNNSRDSVLFADRSDGFFRRAQEEQKPFNLVVGFHDPHRDRSRGGFANEGPFDPRIQDLEINPEDVEVPSWLSDVPQLRQELVEYYRAIYRFDQGVGLILDSLEERGFAHNTLVIVTSDNGPPFINAKTTLFESGMNLPLIVRSPYCPTKGVVNPNMVSWIDILPTMLDFARIPSDLRINKLSPHRLGRSFLPILAETAVLPESAWQHHVFASHTFHQRENYWPTRAVRGRKFKYHRNIAWRLDFPFASDLYASLSFEGMRNMPEPVYLGKRSLRDYIFRPAEQLFNLETDPDETNDLAQNPSYAKELADLRQKLEKWQYETEDPWLYKDGHSLKSLEVWVTEPMKVPNRLDFDPDHPGLDAPGVELLTVEPDLYGIRGSGGFYGPRKERS